ncbi:MAG: Gldg family protein [Dehalococcoidales bacterium]|nr:Gldg family protein [Dehalococcoidales bacterium]
MQTTPSFYRYSGLIAVLGLGALLVGLIVMVLLPGIRLAAWGLLALGAGLLAIAFIIDFRYSGLSAVLGLGALLVGLIVMVLLPGIRLAAWGLLALGAGLLAIAFIIDFRRVRQAITGRRGLFSAGSTVMTSIFIGITLLVNAISIGSYYRFDATGLGQFTLTSQTRDALQEMETPVQALAFFVPGDPYGIGVDIGSYAFSLLEEYQNYTDKLSITEIDPDEHPDQARQYGITQYQSIVFESDLGRRIVPPQEIIQQAEHAFTSAIMEVTGVAQKKVYFLTGHGEHSISGDYTDARQGLLDNLYQVGTLDLLLNPAIPEDASAVIIAGAQQGLTDGEIEILESYLEDGGWLMLLLDPNPPQQVRQLLLPWGVQTEDGTIVDPSSSLSGDINSPIIPRIRNYFGFTGIYFPGSTTVIPQPGYSPQVLPGSGGTFLQIVWASENSSAVMYSLARTSQDSWLERDFQPGREPVFDEGVELKGPLELGFLLFLTPPVDEQGNPTAEVPDTRLVVIGDSDFASNQHFYNGDNGNLFLNSMELLTAGKELISIERKVLPFRRLVASSEVTNFIRISSVFLLPLLVLLGGGVIWWRRR